MAVKAPRPVVPVFSWTGCHVGVSGGGLWGSVPGYTTTSDSVFLQVPPGNPQNIPTVAGFQLSKGYDVSGGLVGGNVGCDYQTGQWVFGVEGDWSALWVTGASPLSPNQAVPRVGGGTYNYAPNDQWSARERWLATLRGRVGFTPADKLLIYATGGAAWARIESTELNVPIGLSTAVYQTDTRLGWTVGAGVDYALNRNWV